MESTTFNYGFLPVAQLQLLDTPQSLVRRSTRTGTAASGNYDRQVGYMAIAEQEISGTDLTNMKSRIVAAMAAKSIVLNVT